MRLVGFAESLVRHHLEQNLKETTWYPSWVVLGSPARV